MHHSGVHKVLYIDYGNTELTTYLCQMPDDLNAMPRLAKHCALVPSKEGTTDDDKCDQGLVSESQLIELCNSGIPFYIESIETEDQQQQPSRIRMFLDAERTKEIRVVAKTPSIECSAVDESTTTIIKTGVDFIASICWLNTSCDFYVQLSESSVILKQIAERLLSAPALGRIEPKVGDLCVAQYVDDGLFYRVRILSIASAEESNNGMRL